MSDAAETPAPTPDATPALPFVCRRCGWGSATEAEHLGHRCNPPPGAPVTSRSDPESFLYDAARLAEFVDKLRASGVKSFEHPSGLRFSFEQASRLPIKPAEGW